jgi:UDP-N-acetylglucosamine acyltransferase
MAIHSTAIVDPQARIDGTVEIGPYCFIGSEVSIGPGTVLKANIYIEGPTSIGAQNIFYPYSSIGVAPQDLKYQGEPAETRIGDRNKIREFITIQRGTRGGGMLTSIGDDNLLMAYVHVAHDVHIGSRTILGNAVTFGGHVTVGDSAIIEAFSGVHQFCRVGRHAFVGGYSVITRDVLPFSMTVTPRESKTYGENKVGLERRGFDESVIGALHKAFRILSKSGLNTSQAIDRITAEVDPSPELDELIAFMRSAERGFIK